MKKKLVLFALLTLLVFSVFSLSGCGSSSDDDAAKEQNDSYYDSYSSEENEPEQDAEANKDSKDTDNITSNVDSNADKDSTASENSNKNANSKSNVSQKPNNYTGNYNSSVKNISNSTSGKKQTFKSKTAKKKRHRPSIAYMPKAVRGSYICEKTASDKKTDTFYYALSIERKTFSIYDFEAGNPGIEGRIYRIGKGKTGKGYIRQGILGIKCNSADFDPPACWKLKLKDKLIYRLVNKNTIKLGHNGIVLTFHRDKE